MGHTYLAGSHGYAPHVVKTLQRHCTITYRREPQMSEEMKFEEVKERTFEQRLMDAMAEMVNPTKDKKVSFGNTRYSYETLDQVLAIIRPALLNHGLALVQGVKWHEQYNGYVLETGAMDAKETRILDVRPMPSCDNAQSEGSWETYKRRYALRTAFGLTGEDDDGEATKRQSKPQLAPQTLMRKVMDAVTTLGDIRGASNDEVIDGLMKTGAMAGCSFDALTTDKANDALSQLNAWINIANEQNMAREDIDF